MALTGTVLPPLAGHRPTATRRTVVRLWLPLTPLWLLLSPLALILAPLILLSPACRHLNPYRAAFGVGAVLLGLSGAAVEVDARDALVRIRIL